MSNRRALICSGWTVGCCKIELGIDDDAQLRRFFVEEAGVGMSPGTLFGDEGSGFMRMNIGAPRRVIKNAWRASGRHAIGQIMDRLPIEKPPYRSPTPRQICIRVPRKLSISATTNSRSGWIAVFLPPYASGPGFILVSRHGGHRHLTSWDIASLRFGVGAVIAVFFLPRVTLPPLRVVALFSLSGGIGYAIAVYAAFRMTPAAHAAVLLPGALPFLNDDHCLAVARPKAGPIPPGGAGCCAGGDLF